MNCMVTDIKIRFNNNDIPNGVYDGFWGGYQVVFKMGYQYFTGQTSIGIRSMRTPCIVIVKDGEVSVKTKKKDNK